MVDPQIGEEVLKFIEPRLKFVSFFVKSGNSKALGELQKLIDCGIKNRYVNFGSSELNIDLDAIEKGKSKEWYSLLMKNIEMLKIMTRFR